MAEPDHKPPRRVRDPELLRRLHIEWRECVLCLTTRGTLSLHHIHKHPRDDVEANLVMLCGHGTTGCHGGVEAGSAFVRQRLGRYLMRERPDTVAYLNRKLRSEEQARAWLERYLLV